MGQSASAVAAVDVSRVAASVYQHNLPTRVTIADLRAVESSRLAQWDADLWWMSPPCQPFTRRGKQRDDEDPRSQSLLRLLPRLAEVQPTHLGMENVVGFQGSRTHGRLLEALDRAGYSVREQTLCPHGLGWPNRRERFYLIASKRPLRPSRRPIAIDFRYLRSLVDPAADEDPRYQVSDDILARYRLAMDIVDRHDDDAVTATFTSAYGRSHVRSGSFLRTAHGVRRFAPHEVLALLGFPKGFGLPPELPLHNGWRLVGNSLSLPAVRTALLGLDLGGPKGAPAKGHRRLS
jgi:site-specific DNA-cytosine methylase